MTWVAITDPIPGGATILGSGLGRDSEIATQGEKRSGSGWPAFEERSFESFRSYYEYLPKGTVTMEYTVRLNNVGDFALPPSRVEALYAPEMFGEAPNARVKVMSSTQTNGVERASLYNMEGAPERTSATPATTSTAPMAGYTKGLYQSTEDE
jgi:hypothetical protein